METFIYALCDPVTHEIRYIGKTNDPARRYNCHLASGRIKSVRKWIKSLLPLHLKPELIILASCSIDTWRKREDEWIKFGQENKWPLLNKHHGGGGHDGYSSLLREKGNFVFYNGKTPCGEKC